MTKVSLQDNKAIKEIFQNIEQLKQSISNEIKEIKEMVETLKKLTEEEKTLTAYDIEIAWVKFRLDFLTGVKKVSSERFKFLKEYMNNIDLKNIPFELKYYIKEAKNDESN